LNVLKLDCTEKGILYCNRKAFYSNFKLAHDLNYAVSNHEWGKVYQSAYLKLAMSHQLTIFPGSRHQLASTRNWGIWVDLPHPVSPTTTKTWWLSSKNRIC